MTKAEIQTAKTLLRDRTDRIETMGDEHATGGWCVTAHWHDGGQQRFVSIDEIRTHIASHS